MKLKTFFLFIGAFLLVACATTPNYDEELEAPKREDPAIERQQKENERLGRQTAAQMGQTLKVPSVTYEFDSIRPPDEAYPILDKVTEVMLQNPTLHLVLEGHTDLIGSDDYNYWLAASRAAAMKSYLVSRGINAERIRIHSFGKTRPITRDTTPKGRTANRRVEFRFTTRKWQAVY